MTFADGVQAHASPAARSQPVEARILALAQSPVVARLAVYTTSSRCPYDLSP